VSGLEDLQRIAQRHLLQGGPLPDTLVDALAPPVEERWGIYCEGYRLRLVASLATTYGALAARLGREAFATVARAFIDEHPSSFRSLRDYGVEFAAFLQERADDAETRLHADLAAFEWHLAAAFDAPDATATTVAALATLAPHEWPGLSFRAVPGLGRLRTTTNAVAVWRTCRAALEADHAAGPVTDPPAIDADSVEWLVVRPALETRFRSLPDDEAEAFDRVLGGASFAELGEALAVRHGENAPLVAATWLKGWLTEGALLRV
jgi:hypothetical protein